MPPRSCAPLSILPSRRGPDTGHPRRRPLDRRDSRHDLAGAGCRVVRAAAGSDRGRAALWRGVDGPSVRSGRRAARARRGHRGQARAGERHTGPRIEPRGGDGRRQPRVRERHPRGDRSGRRGDPAGAVLLQPRDGDRHRGRARGPCPHVPRLSARRAGHRRCDYLPDAGHRHRLSQQPDRRGVLRRVAPCGERALPGSRPLPHPRRGVPSTSPTTPCRPIRRERSTAHPATPFRSIRCRRRTAWPAGGSGTW